MKAIVGNRQSSIDIAIQYLGSAEGCFFIAQKLGVSITDRLVPGTILEYDAGDIIDKSVADHYSNNNIIPTTDEQ